MRDWICTRCGETAYSKCPYQRSVFPEDQHAAMMSEVLGYAVGYNESGRYKPKSVFEVSLDFSKFPQGRERALMTGLVDGSIKFWSKVDVMKRVLNRMPAIFPFKEPAHGKWQLTDRMIEAAADEMAYEVVMRAPDHEKEAYELRKKWVLDLVQRIKDTPEEVFKHWLCGHIWVKDSDSLKKQKCSLGCEHTTIGMVRAEQKKED